ncbi:hypothetical protein HPB51_029670 [Rhipicephalus microplus]|uniref:Tick transposon n=1 Tax=Rhipicephalus microplus TaxID=6941 RepID=A0A9J6CU56_RHIMP|nr:hypothetical protein HPB51_029670 [Rhipicephalus microplus]
MMQKLSKTHKTGGDTTVIYQWNCRGVCNKEVELLLNIDGQENKPDIIALQETNGKPRLPGYVIYIDTTENGTAVLVRSNVVATQHVTAQGGRENMLVEIHARKIGSSGNLFVISVYCRPSERQYNLHRTVSHAKGLAETRSILGAFKAPHTTWGYKLKSIQERESVSQSNGGSRDGPPERAGRNHQMMQECHEGYYARPDVVIRHTRRNMEKERRRLGV